MSISSISSIYNTLYSSAISKTTSSDEASATNGSSGTSSLADILELGSYDDDLSAYLNYNSSGSYSNMTTLLDYLAVDDDGTNLYNNAKSSSNSLEDLLYPDRSDDSSSGIFDSLISAKSKEIDNMISAAMEKLESMGTKTGSDNTDNEE